MKNTKSNKLFETAKKFIPGGVNSPVRAFKSVGTTPRFIARAKGAYLWDADDNRYIDYIGSWGPMILGHSHPSIIKAIREKAKHGTSFGAPTELEVNIAELITKMVPSIEMLRMVNSGTEATMSAIRLARAYTGKDKIIKFDGCYHGHADSFLIKAGSGAATFGTPDSPGVTKSTAADTLNATFNNIESVKKIIGDHKSEIAAIIVEPIVGNMGCIPPKPGFLEALRVLCTKQNIILIFDEVMTGFRVSPGGAQELYGIKPDLTTLGKIIGGGLPVGAYGGKREIMEMVAPNGPMYQAGTLSGNPLAMAAGFEMLSILNKNKSIYKQLEQSSKQIEEVFKENLKKLNLDFVINRVGSMFTLFFTNNEVTDADSARRSDTNLFGIYFRAMLENGIYLPPSQYEAAFVSTEHTRYLIDKTIRANFKSLKAVLDSMK
jgi:glutamate-1-semialdehyde 2,1-aminomutase